MTRLLSRPSSASLPRASAKTPAIRPIPCLAIAGVLTLAAAAGEASAAAGNIIFQDGFEAPLTAGTCAIDGLSRLTRSDITYGPIHPTQINPARPNVEVVEWDNVWGHSSATDAVTPWPGKTGSAPTLRNFMRSSFVAIHFHTPANASAASTMKGFFTYPIDWNNPNADMKISPLCGDFDPSPDNAGCVALDTAADNEISIFWKFSPGGTANFCVLQPDKDYYFNVRLTDPSSQLRCDPQFGIYGCPLYLVHTFGGAF